VRQEEPPQPLSRLGGTDYAMRGVAMQQPTDQPPTSEGPEPELVCPCGKAGHAPVRVGLTFSSSGPERDLYDCPAAATHRYGLGPVS